MWTAKQIHEVFGISRSTLIRWESSDKISTNRMPGGKRLYDKEQIQSVLGIYNPRCHVIYARVSSRKQQNDLTRQIMDLRAAFKVSGIGGVATVISDIASGLNEKRKGFIRMIEMMHREKIDTLWVTTLDRLCRYGVGIVKTIAQLTGTRIKTIHASSGRSDSEQVADDMLAIVNVFVARHNGKKGTTQAPAANF